MKLYEKKEEVFFEEYPYTLYFDGENSHYLVFDSKEERHKVWLALQLGNCFDPLTSPDDWCLLRESFWKQRSVLKEEEMDDCCHSGCRGCPNYL